MLRHLGANLWLLLVTFVICAVIYPFSLLAIGQGLFPHKALGSLVDKEGRTTTTEKDAVGSHLIAQPFTGDEYFQTRPSAASYNAAASAATNWGASNYLLRDRVARQLGPLVKYAHGAKKGQRVAPDVEAWFQKDRYQGKAGIVAQWAQAHPALAAAWVKADPLSAGYLTAWQNDHPAQVAAWLKENPATPEPKPEDLAVAFFTDFAAAHPGTFLALVEGKTDGKSRKLVEPVTVGSEIQSVFFDMWRQEHADVELAPVPADMVTASASGLDPHITLQSALYQVERVSAKWAETTNGQPSQIRAEIETLLHQKAVAPLGGLVGVEMINVLEVNLALRKKYG